MKRWMDNWYSNLNNEYTLFADGKALELWKNYDTPDEELIKKGSMSKYNEMTLLAQKLVAEDDFNAI